MSATTRERLSHFTFAWYTFPMSTGGLALLLLTNPANHHELKVIGKALFFVNAAIFLAISSILMVRFATGCANFIKTLKHPLESLFVGPFFLALATLINCTASLAGRDASEGMVFTLRVVFWLYTLLVFCQSLISYTILFCEAKHEVASMTPGWVLPIFPSMLVGTVANAIVQTQPPERAFEMAIAGCTFQGLGFTVCCMMYAILFRRLMTFGLPHVNHRPGLFICVGPPSFTCLAIIGLAKESFRFLPDKVILDLPREQVASILVVLATIASIFLWLISAWFWCLAMITIIVGTIKDPSHMTFILAWWAFIFPNVGFAIATNALANVLQSEAIRNLAVAMMVFLIVAWITVLGFNIDAIYSRKIMWHGKDEDRDLSADHSTQAHHEVKDLKVESMSSGKSTKCPEPNSPDETHDNLYSTDYWISRPLQRNCQQCSQDALHPPLEERFDRQHSRQDSLRRRNPSVQRDAHRLSPGEAVAYPHEPVSFRPSARNKRPVAHTKQAWSYGGRDTNQVSQYHGRSVPVSRGPQQQNFCGLWAIEEDDPDWYEKRIGLHDNSGVQTVVGSPNNSPTQKGIKVFEDEVELTEIRIPDDIIDLR